VKRRRGRVFRSAKTTGPASCEHCRARIVFVTMTTTGKRVPVDPIPDDKGTVCGRLIGTKLQGYVISKDHPYERPYTRYAAHFATCSDRPRPAPKPPTEDPLLLFDLEDR
jgi:DNA-directed RNA polymerase subunit RPC12/RpoP